jgi:hypothetical protein
MTDIFAIVQVLTALGCAALVFVNFRAGNQQAVLGWLCALFYWFAYFF